MIIEDLVAMVMQTSIQDLSFSSNHHHGNHHGDGVFPHYWLMKGLGAH